MRLRHTENQEGRLFAELRSLLHGRSHDPRTWAHVCEILDQTADTDTALHYVGSHLASWPPHKRPAPPSWLSAKLDHKLPRYWALVHAICCDHAVLEVSLCKGLLDLVLEGEQVVAFQARSAHINESEMWTLFGHEAWRSVSHLDLSLTPLDRAKAIALANADALSTLETLHLGSTKLQNQGLIALGEAEGLHALRELGLCDTRIGVLGLQVLEKALWWPMLRRLDLSGNHLGRHGASVLGEALTRSGIKHLTLKGCGLGLEGVLSLVEVADFPVTHLDLQKNDLRDDAIIALASSPLLQGVTSLHLGYNRLGDKSVRALLDSSYTGSLRRLWLHWNPISPDAKTWLDAHGIIHDVTPADWRRTLKVSDATRLL